MKIDTETVPADGDFGRGRSIVYLGMNTTADIRYLQYNLESNRDFSQDSHHRLP